MKGDLDPLRAAIATVTPEEDASGAIRDLHNLILHFGIMTLIPYRGFPNRLPRPRSCSIPSNIPKAVDEGLAARMRGDKKGAQAAFAAARLEVEKAVLADASDGRASSLLAMIDAGLAR